MRSLLVVAALCVTGAACYSPSYSNCEITCSTGTGCPSGLECTGGFCVEHGGSCNGSGLGDDAGMDADLGAANRVFVTSSTYAGNLSGLTGADGICAARAAEGGLTGTFIALLASGNQSAVARIANARGWVDTRGRPIADKPDMWMSGTTYFPVLYDEHMTLQTGAAWGGSPNQTCSDWTSNAPNPVGTILPLTDAPDFTAPRAPCAMVEHLICLEADKNVMVKPPVSAGRTMFVTTTAWTPNGLNGADAFCKAQAAAAGLTGTYQAFLGTNGAGPEVRFDPSGAPFRRIDGVLLAPTAADFLNGPETMPLASWPIRPDGQANPGGLVWTGAKDQCGGWSSNATQIGSVGKAASTARSLFRLSTNATCNSTLPILCAETVAMP